MSTTSIQLASRIFATERSLYTFIERMAKNEVFAKDKPNTHKFFASLHNFRSVNGRLTDNQKQAIVREINKNLEYFDKLRTPIITLSVEKTGIISRPISESEFVEMHGMTDEDSLASAEADRMAAMDAE